MTTYVQTATGDILKPHGDWQSFGLSFIPGDHGTIPCQDPGSEEMEQSDDRIIWVNRAFIVKAWRA